ncbi:MAG: hypothetical protein KF681_15075 [Bdellovibrionaceae bacterium]|nr:hypothetical protein [Pseudobdellovibrionaceae bacterium]
MFRPSSWILILLFAPLSVWGQDKRLTQKLGGEGSVRSDSLDAFSFPVRNIKSANRKDFMVGKSFFRQNWVSFPASVESLEGLGPLFIAQSCIACHERDGRGRPAVDGKEEFRALLFRLSIPGSKEQQARFHGGPVPVPNYGDQLQNFAIPGVKPEAKVRASFTETSGSFADGITYTLQKPVFRFEDLAYGPFPKDVMVSPRLAPGAFGMGLLEAIDEKDILKNADPDDLDGDGISGRPNFTWDERAQKRALGRFGWKANQPTVLQQTAAAFNGDMGVTSPVFPHQNCEPAQKDCLAAKAKSTPEISQSDLQKVSAYMHLLTVPQSQALTEGQIKTGQRLLRELTCTKCHVETYRTGTGTEFAENHNQIIHPYTDLLLHDMGDDLADGRPDFEASGREWRTPPLWGLGRSRKVNPQTRFLHDGRARTPEEAILWHGGEGEGAREKYKALDQSQRDQLLTYLESL